MVVAGTGVLLDGVVRDRWLLNLEGRAIRICRQFGCRWERRFGQSNWKVDLPFPKEQAGGEEVGDGGPVGHPREVMDRQVEV